MGGYFRIPFASSSLGGEQPQLNSELLGFGRDPVAELLFEISTGNAVAKRRLEIAGAQRPKEATRESAKCLASVALG